MFHIFKKKNTKGYSLPEVIVAIAILGLLGAMFSQISFSSLKARDSSRERLAALAIATSAIDEIKAWRGNNNGTNEWVTLTHLRTNFLASIDLENPGKLGYYTNQSDGALNTYLKTYTDSNRIDYEVELKIIEEPTLTSLGLFDLQITINSPNVKGWKMQTRIRGK